MLRRLRDLAKELRMLKANIESARAQEGRPRLRRRE
jgi:hypothetical protein